MNETMASIHGVVQPPAGSSEVHHQGGIFDASKPNHIDQHHHGNHQNTNAQDEGFWGLNIEKKQATQLEMIQEQLGNDPFQMGKCPFCQRDNITTSIEQRTGSRAMLSFFIALLLLGQFTFIVIPPLIHFLGDVHHACPRCDNFIGKSQNTFTCLPKVSNEVVTVKIGSCAAIVSKKLLYSLTFFIGGLFVVAGVWDFLNSHGLPQLPEGPFVNLTYLDWLDDCSTSKLRGNPLNVQQQFASKWEGHAVEWQGYLSRVEMGYFKKNTMIIEMPDVQKVLATITTPDLALKKKYPKSPEKIDKYLALIFDESLNTAVSSMDVGDPLRFRATILAKASRHQPAIFYMHALERASVETMPESLISAKATAAMERGGMLTNADDAVVVGDAEVLSEGAEPQISKKKSKKKKV